MDHLWIAWQPEFFPVDLFPETRARDKSIAPSHVSSLDPSPRSTRMFRRPSGLIVSTNLIFSVLTVVIVRRFEEIINGREYLIEVARIGVDRWRAEIARVPGGSAALMPFYGSTPDEAARQLSQWLIRAHRSASNPV